MMESDDKIAELQRQVELLLARVAALEARPMGLYQIAEPPVSPRPPDFIPYFTAIGDNSGTVTTTLGKLPDGYIIR